MKNRICSLFSIKYPIIQAGMVWCSGWELASAVSKVGGLGILGAGSMYPEVLESHIRKVKTATDKPFAVNVPLLYPDIEKHMEIIIREQVPFVFTSAGNPRTWTSTLKENGIGVIHVVSSTRFAQKAADAGVDAIVAEGFEAGGHNGREETTTFCLIPQVTKAVELPIIAAGGIGTGSAIAAVLVLGADGVQLGTRFVASAESSAHLAFKQAVVAAKEGSTSLTLKELTPVRLLHNSFYTQLQEAYSRKASTEELRNILGRGRAKKGMFEGDLEEGELEIGQISGMIDQILPAETILRQLIAEYLNTGVKQLGGKYCWE